MLLQIVAIGRERDSFYRQAFASYAQRLHGRLHLREIELKKEDSDTALLAAVPDRAAVVVLDERGQDLTSRDLARRLEGWRDQGIQAAAFLIGGPDGHGVSIRQRADLVLALGRMTWPHRLVRVMLAEQLYRAQTILAGHPYHRD